MENLKDKASGKVDEVTGKGKEAVGRATGDRSLEAEGKGEQVLGTAKQGFADAKEWVDHALDQDAKQNNS
jgi:uncharacterized protein YjbJ (UPF0337 family)